MPKTLKCAGCKRIGVVRKRWEWAEGEEGKLRADCLTCLMFEIENFVEGRMIGTLHVSGPENDVPGKIEVE